MNNKKYLWLVIIVVVIAAAIVIFVNLPKQTSTSLNSVGEEKATNGEVAEVAEVAGSEATTLPIGLTPIPSPASDPTFNEEAVITVDANGFSPKTLTVKAGTKAFLTFSASDDERHTFAFTDPSLDFILVVFNKAEGDKSITFPAPEAGSYTYYIDDKENTGIMTVK